VTEPEDDFATMFEASERARRVTRGQTIEGTIVAIGAEVALVSVGGKSEAEIDISELLDEAGHLEVKVGEKVDAGSVLCRIYYTKEDNVDEAADMVEGAFHVSSQKPDERELILEVVG